MTRHKWATTQSLWNGGAVQRCARCETERTRDDSTATLWLYRRGRAIPPGHKPRALDETWAAYRAGVIPTCPGKAVSLPPAKVAP